jgi:propionate catabolism operon transcriptional regulator
MHPRRLESPTARLPVIWTVAVSRLSQLFNEVIPEFDGRAEIHAIPLGYDDAVQHIRQRLQRQSCDVLISAGSNAAYLRNRVARPLVLVRASGFDLMQALSRARRISERIGVVTHESDLPVFAEFQRSFGLDIAQRSFVTAEDARACVADLIARGVGAIVGTGLVTDLAEQAGVTGVLMYSAESIRQAFDSALDIARPLLQEPRDSLRRRSSATRFGLDDLSGESQGMRELRERIQQAAQSDATVLIQGESGSGKELAAQALHASSPRRRGPFVAVNCSAIPESLLESELFGHDDGAFTGARRGGRSGLIEAAHRGSLFLDEIGDMPSSLQTRLLRVLEEREVIRLGANEAQPVDLRVIAASHVDLRHAVQEGRFRRDLFYRLDVLRLAMPSLRDRPDDLTALIDALLARLRSRSTMSTALRFDAEALRLLQQHDWPGNVRELRNLLERLLILRPEHGHVDRGLLLLHAPELGTNHLQDTEAMTLHRRSAPHPHGTPSRPSRRELQDALALHGNRDALQRAWGISRTTLWRWMREVESG